jgi:hypothetical protein
METKTKLLLAALLGAISLGSWAAQSSLSITMDDPNAAGDVKLLDSSNQVISEVGGAWDTTFVDGATYHFVDDSDGGKILCSIATKAPYVVYSSDNKCDIETSTGIDPQGGTIVEANITLH